MKEDEQWLLKELYKEHLKKPIYNRTENIVDFLFQKKTYKSAREIIEDQDKYNNKRLWYVLDKFSDKDIVGVGVSLGSAWLTDKGIEEAKELC